MAISGEGGSSALQEEMVGAVRGVLEQVRGRTRQCTLVLLGPSYIIKKNLF